jgi:UDPglucose--hexose-1-phosphate uridylyltransferase
METNNKNKNVSELRQDIVMGEWVVIATTRGERPGDLAIKSADTSQDISKCPFEDPFLEQEPLLVQLKEGGVDPKKDWSLVVLRNKFPAFTKGDCTIFEKEGPYLKTGSIGHHEVVILKEHGKFIPDISLDEVCSMIDAYHRRFIEISKDECVRYISVFHNHGKEAGASIGHLHSQIIASSVLPVNVKRSLCGAKKYFEKNGKCVHCDVIDFELKDKKRIVFENDKFIVVVPFASKIAFQMEIFPKEHQSSFSMLKKEDVYFFAEALQSTITKLKKGVNDPPFNFFIHTTPVKNSEFEHYHWHLEILPKTAIWAGFELGTGMEISAVIPEDAAEFLREIN